MKCANSANVFGRLNALQSGVPSWNETYNWAQSSLVEGGEGSYLSNCQTNLVIVLFTLSLLFWKFINTTAYHLGRYEPSSPISCRAPRTSITYCLGLKLPTLFHPISWLVWDSFTYDIGTWSGCVFELSNVYECKGPQVSFYSNQCDQIGQLLKVFGY